MAFRRSYSISLPISLLSIISTVILILVVPTTTAVAATNIRLSFLRKSSKTLPVFREAPAFRNGDECANDLVHVAMTLDSNYLRGTMAAVFSILKHSFCPENVFFHFMWSRYDEEIYKNIKTTFPYLKFKVYKFDTNKVRAKISKSIRQALDQPLNYARVYLADILPTHVNRAIYLDSDIIMVDDIEKLWKVNLGDKALAAPEYCEANFKRYFTHDFWLDPELTKTFNGRNPCYFNTGVMVVDVQKWRDFGYSFKVEEWMAVQKQRRIYQLGSLPPFLLVFAGNIKGIDHRWNQHGLGGDNIEGRCRSLHPGPISLLHWSGKGKPWLRLDSRKPCTVDHLWAPYDLYRSSKQILEE